MHSFFLMMTSLSLQAQNTESLNARVDLDACIAFALRHQPVVQQAAIDQEITDRIIRSNLSGWLPQIGLNYNIQHYLKAPSVTNPLILRNSSTAGLALSQTIFNSDVLLASKTAGDTRLNAWQNTQLTKIDLVAGVTKAFYDVLVTMEQIDILTQDVVRLRKSIRDTRLQYEAGTVDKTDYKRAAIALNNALKSKKRYEEMLKAKFSFLKQQMGLRDSVILRIAYDSSRLQEEITKKPDVLPAYENRVEYQQLKTRRKLLAYNFRFTKWNYIPVVTFLAGYNLVGQNKKFSKIYSEGFPNSFVGLTLAVPLFQGTKRVQATRLAQLQLQRLEMDFQNLELAINTEYSNAISVYNASLNDYLVSKENLSLAREVYNTVQLQYQSGVKTYLDVIIAETDLRTSEVNTLDALFLLLSSKVDVQRAAGTITF